MGLEITTLIENSPGEHTGLAIEHGISFFIETGETSVLFDTGRSDNYLKNAVKLRKDLRKTSHLILSHGHYDHTGGFRPFIDTGTAPASTLWVGEGFFRKKYSKSGPAYQYVGNDFGCDYLKKSKVSCSVASADKQEIAPGIWIVTHFSGKHVQEAINKKFVVFQEKDGREVIDDFHDEILVVVESDRGLVVLVGCSHPGILNMIDTVNEHFSEPVYALLGGTHLVAADEQRIDCTVNDFLQRNIPLWGISHCTGERAVSQMEKRLPGLFRNCTGTSLIIG